MRFMFPPGRVQGPADITDGVAGKDPSLVERFVVEFLEGLETHDLPRKRVGVHFATPHLSAHALEGIKAATSRFQARGPRSHDGTHTVVIARGV
jgi:hypothetical protein